MFSRDKSIIRPAGLQDIPVVAGLYHRVWHETHGPYMPRPEREARGECFFLNRTASLMPNIVVGENEGAVIGFAAWKEGLLGQLFLAAAARGSGLAHRLMEAAEQELYDQDVREAELHCLVGNEGAKRFYEREGWRLCEIMAEPVRSNMDGERRDFWVMRKRLTPRVSNHPLRTRGPNSN